MNYATLCYHVTQAKKHSYKKEKVRLAGTATRPGGRLLNEDEEDELVDLIRNCGAVGATLPPLESFMIWSVIFVSGHIGRQWRFHKNWFTAFKKRHKMHIQHVTCAWRVSAHSGAATSRLP